LEKKLQRTILELSENLHREGINQEGKKTNNSTEEDEISNPLKNSQTCESKHIFLIFLSRQTVNLAYESRHEVVF